MADITLAQRVARLESQNRILKLLATLPTVILSIALLTGMARQEPQEPQEPKRIVVDELVAKRILADVIQLKDKESEQETTLKGGQVMCWDSRSGKERSQALLHPWGFTVLCGEYRGSLGGSPDVDRMSLMFDLGGKSHGGSLEFPPRMVVLKSDNAGSSLTISDADGKGRCVLGVQEVDGSAGKVEKRGAGRLSLWGTDGTLQQSLPVK